MSEGIKNEIQFVRVCVCAFSSFELDSPQYTLGFILTLVALVVVGLFLRSDAGAATGANSWINVLAGSYATADRVAVFFIGCLSAFGSLFMVFYTVCSVCA
jgi:hypothetical protein